MTDTKKREGSDSLDELVGQNYYNEGKNMCKTVDGLDGVFVTAKLKGSDECRQGWIINRNPLQIQGESGKIYDVVNPVTTVANPPKSPNPEWLKARVRARSK